MSDHREAIEPFGNNIGFLKCSVGSPLAIIMAF